MTEMQTHICAACAAGFPEECYNPQVLYAIDTGSPDAGILEWIMPCSVEFTAYAPVGKEKGLVGRPLLSPEQITDVKSTGRKRAAAIMPFLQGQVCMWAGLKHAGGGVVPILGCEGNTIADVKTTEGAHAKGANEVGHRHHGPDKNVLNNTPGINLHGVCTPCHTRWHVLNDPHYDEDGRPDNAAVPFLPVEEYYQHDGQTTFTEEEKLIEEAWWDLPVKDRDEYPFAPPETARKMLPIVLDPATLDSSNNPFADDDPFTEIGDSA